MLDEAQEYNRKFRGDSGAEESAQAAAGAVRKVCKGTSGCVFERNSGAF